MTWTVEQQGGIPLLRHTLTSGDTARLLIIGDAHWDHPRCNRDALSALLDHAVTRNAAILHLGDYFDAMQGRSDRRSRKSDLRPEHQRDDYFTALTETAAQWLAPYRDHLAVMLHGNHETAIIKHNEVDLLAELRARLGGVMLTPGYQTYVMLRFMWRGGGSESVPIWVGHGVGSRLGWQARARQRSVMYPDAHIIATGHTHESRYMPMVQWRVGVRGAPRRAVQRHLNVGGWKDDYGDGRSGWAVERGYGPSEPAGWWLSFRRGPDGRVGCTTTEAR